MEPKPLLDALVEYFEELEYRRFEERVFLLLDQIIRGPED